MKPRYAKPKEAVMWNVKELTSMNRLAAAIVALSLVACTPQQLVDANRYTDQIAAACQQALIVAPMFPWIKPWVVDCQTAAGIAKLALDSGSLAWLTGILGRL